MSQGFNHYLTVNHLDLLDAARTMTDRPSAQKAGLLFDVAYNAIATVDFAHRHPLIGGSANMSPTDLFGLASSLDIQLSHGDPAQTQKAATFAVELVNTLGAATEPETKQGILGKVLGIELPPKTPVAQQLVERRLLPEGDIKAQMALSALITDSARSM